MKILFVSLGCDKNLVDTENMLGILKNKGFEFTDDEWDADIIAVNTCCFIGDAKQESINIKVTAIPTAIRSTLSQSAYNIFLNISESKSVRYELIIIHGTTK